jgi:hypothetical protein
MGVGIGFILSKLITELTLGMGIIAGSIFSIGTIYFWLKLLTSNDLHEAILNYENEDSDSEDEKPYVIIPGQYSKPLRKKRKKKIKA